MRPGGRARPAFSAAPRACCHCVCGGAPVWRTRGPAARRSPALGVRRASARFMAYGARVRAVRGCDAAGWRVGWAGGRATCRSRGAAAAGSALVPAAAAGAAAARGGARAARGLAQACACAAPSALAGQTAIASCAGGHDASCLFESRTTYVVVVDRVNIRKTHDTRTCLFQLSNCFEVAQALEGRAVDHGGMHA